MATVEKYQDSVLLKEESWTNEKNEYYLVGVSRLPPGPVVQWESGAFQSVCNSTAVSCTLFTQFTPTAHTRVVLAVFRVTKQ